MLWNNLAFRIFAYALLVVGVVGAVGIFVLAGVVMIPDCQFGAWGHSICPRG